ncbi:hypothetical protein BP5796_09658 [Coleophoma crateriformis]|uniref:Uncharacterized protein n=1 Tax=Coleophoma crateriformis TaxID=565419 RepID=A0A3D8QYP4_9HELO|nr:hypothetical protein BP5796_09658 [Coleophoma crateriformis]
MEYGFCPPNSDEAAGSLARSSRRSWYDLCERISGCVARGQGQESITTLANVQGIEEVVPDTALWAALVALGMLYSFHRYEDKYNGSEGANVSSRITVSIS